MIVITGALGFIGSCLIRKLNDEGLGNSLMAVDDFYKDFKEPNLINKRIREWVHRDIFLELFEKMPSQVSFVFHLGARTDTSSKDKAIFQGTQCLLFKKNLGDLYAAPNTPGLCFQRCNLR